MKWIFFVILLLLQSPGWAADQYSKARCDNLKQEKEQIRKRFNAGYGVAEGEWLKQQDEKLFQKIASHCNSPIADTTAEVSDEEPGAPRQTLRYQSAATSTYAGKTLQQMPAWSGNNAIFKGDKVAAWTEFYQVPRQCRQKQLTESEFVQCADDKAAQKRRFEQRWQQLTFVPLTAGTAKARTTTVLQPVIETIEAYPAKLAPAAATTSNPPAATGSRYVDNIQQQFHWVGIVIIGILVALSWLIWFKL